MTRIESAKSAQSAANLLLALASGAAALIYEIVWFQILELIIGSSAVSLAVVLATFMGGTCLGSLLFPRLISRRHHPLRVYAAMEFGIAGFGVAILLLMPLFGTAILLLPPTLLMGATLPALSRRVGATSDRSFWLGFLYAANIAGAVVGCLLAGFYLLREYDVTTATLCAAALNVAVGAAALLLAALSPVPHDEETRSVEDTALAGFPKSAAVFVAIGLSGFCALAGEAVWTRILALLFGGSVYTFSIVLAVFLVGLGIGSSLGSLISRTIKRPIVALGWCQLIVAVAIAWTSYTLSASLPYWPINPSIATDIWFNFQIDLDRAFWALLPPTLLWGASFPLALAAIVHGQDSGKLMARIYAANTLGAVIGALVASLLLIAWVGSQRVQQLLIVMSIASGLLLLVRETRAKAIATGIVAILLCVLLVWSVPPVSKVLIAHGRFAATWVGKSDILYAKEGVNSSVAVSSFPTGALTFHVAGKIQASNVPRDMRLQRMLGHLTTLMSANPRSVLVIGCGAGITAGAVSIDPRVEHLTIVEIEPLVPEAASTYFSHQNFDVLHNSKVALRIDDGRHYLQTTDQRFDAITADPLDPWVKGAANLYTKEFFEEAKRHLNPGGVITMYMQLFENTPEAVKSAVATFFEVFPNGTLWGNTFEGKGHDMVMLGQVEPLRIDLDAMDRRLSEESFATVKQSLREVGMSSAVDLFATYAGRGSELTEWLRGAPINRDRNLRMQYLAGLGLNLDDAAAIYAEMLTYRRFPEDLFHSATGFDALKRAIEENRGQTGR